MTLGHYWRESMLDRKEPESRIAIYPEQPCIISKSPKKFFADVEKWKAASQYCTIRLIDYNDDLIDLLRRIKLQRERLNHA